MSLGGVKWYGCVLVDLVIKYALGGVKWYGCVLVDLVIKYVTWRC